MKLLRVTTGLILLSGALAAATGDLRLIDAAVDQYAIENNKGSGTLVRTVDWTVYLKAGTALYTTGKDTLGNPYGSQTVDQIPRVPANTFKSLSDVAPSTFWAPYY